MLILTRKKNESIHFSGGIKITVFDIRCGNVRLGIEAPPEIRINRDIPVEVNSRPQPKISLIKEQK